MFKNICSLLVIFFCLLPVQAFSEQAPQAAAPTHNESITGMEFIFIKGGCYEMGCGDWTSECGKDEKPTHEVCVDDFWLAKHEVSQGQWKKIMADNPATFTLGDNHPIETISWDDATDFIRQLNILTGKTYRLPTEAEWEYAARSGGKNETYSGGNNYEGLSWCSFNSGNKTQPVGTKTVNGLGLYDMSGNVSEWVWDKYQVDYYHKSPRDNPIGPATGPGRVYRGGCWGNVPGFLRVTARNWSPSDTPSEFIGVRLVLDE